MFQDVSPVFHMCCTCVHNVPAILAIRFVALSPRAPAAQRWDQQFAGGRAAGRHLTLGTYWGGPLRLLREGGCRWMPKIGWMSDGEWWWMILNDGGIPEYDDFSWWWWYVLKMVNDGEWLMMVKWWRVQVAVPLLLRMNDDGEWWLMVNYDLPGYGREWMLMDVISCYIYSPLVNVLTCSIKHQDDLYYIYIWMLIDVTSTANGISWRSHQP